MSPRSSTWRKPPRTADGQRPVDLGGGALVRGSVAGAIDEAQHLAGVGQRHDQRVVAPGAVVGDVHALLALARSWPTRVPSMSISGAVEERPRAGSAQTFDAGVVDDVEQGVRCGCGLEAAAEVAGGGRVGDAAGAEGVEEVLVVAAQFDVLQTGAVTQGVVGDVENVVGLVIGQVDLQEVKSLVDGLDQTEVAGQGMDGADAAVGDGLCFVGDLVVNVAGRQQGLIADVIRDLSRRRWLRDLYFRNHRRKIASLEILLWACVCGAGYSSNPAKRRRISSFSFSPCSNPIRPRLFKG